MFWMSMSRLKQFWMNLVSIICGNSREIWRVWNDFWMLIAAVSENPLCVLLFLTMTTFFMALLIFKKNQMPCLSQFCIGQKILYSIFVFCNLDGVKEFYQSRLKILLLQMAEIMESASFSIAGRLESNMLAIRSLKLLELKMWTAGRIVVMCWRILHYPVLWKKLIWFSFSESKNSSVTWSLTKFGSWLLMLLSNHQFFYLVSGDIAFLAIMIGKKNFELFWCLFYDLYCAD